MKRGLFFATAAGAIWGLGYVLPLFVPNFNPVEVVCGRYLVFGIFSLIISCFSAIPLHKTSKEVWKISLLYALTGNIVFYLFLSWSLQLIPAALVTLLFGLMPITISIAGNLTRKEFSNSILIFPLFLIFLGTFAIHWHEIIFDKEISHAHFFSALLMIALAIGNWTWYVIHNANYLKNTPSLTESHLTTTIGICSLFLGLLLFALLHLFLPEKVTLFSELSQQELLSFLSVSLVLGIGLSWIATQFWSYAIRHLPITLSGQLIVTEIIFGLAYFFFIEKRLPKMGESIGITLVLSGVMLGLYKIHQAKKREEEEKLSST